MNPFFTIFTSPFFVNLPTELKSAIQAHAASGKAFTAEFIKNLPKFKELPKQSQNQLRAKLTQATVPPTQAQQAPQNAPGTTNNPQAVVPQNKAAPKPFKIDVEKVKNKLNKQAPAPQPVVPPENLPDGQKQPPQGSQIKAPKEMPTGNWKIIYDHFSIPHSGNDGGPFAEFGICFWDGQCYRLGLRFIGGKSFWYPEEKYDSPEEVVASVQGYASVSWACNPKSSHYDPRFKKWAVF